MERTVAIRRAVLERTVAIRRAVLERTLSTRKAVLERTLSTRKAVLERTLSTRKAVVERTVVGSTVSTFMVVIHTVTIEIRIAISMSRDCSATGCQVSG